MRFKKGDIVELMPTNNGYQMYKYEQFIIENIGKNFNGCSLLSNSKVYVLLSDSEINFSLKYYRKLKLKQIRNEI
jgi:hypothetical protein